MDLELCTYSVDETYYPECYPRGPGYRTYCEEFCLGLVDGKTWEESRRNYLIKLQGYLERTLKELEEEIS